MSIQTLNFRMLATTPLTPSLNVSSWSCLLLSLELSQKNSRAKSAVNHNCSFGLLIISPQSVQNCSHTNGSSFLKATTYSVECAWRSMNIVRLNKEVTCVLFSDGLYFFPFSQHWPFGFAGLSEESNQQPIVQCQRLSRGTWDIYPRASGK